MCEFTLLVLSVTFLTQLQIPLSSFALVLYCPSSCNDSNSLMQMVCLSLGPCWDHQPTSCGHSLAPGREGPCIGEGEERARGKRGFRFDAWRAYPQTDWHPQAKKDLWIREGVIEWCVCALLTETSKIGASSRFKH